MPFRHMLASRFVLLSLGALVASTALAATALARALVLETPPIARREATLRYATLQGGARIPADLLEGAAAAAPFSPTRQAIAPPAEAGAPHQEVGALELVGTVVSSGSGSDAGGFVLVSVNGESAKMLRVGESIAGHTLRSIAQASAVFTRNDDGARVELRVPRSR